MALTTNQRLDSIDKNLSKHAQTNAVKQMAVTNASGIEQIVSSNRVFNWAIGTIIIVFVASVGWLMAGQTIMWQELLTMD